MGDRRQRDQEKQVSPIYPWVYMQREVREVEEQPHKLLPFYEAPTWKKSQSRVLISPFLSRNTKNQGKSGRKFGEYRKIC